MQAIVRVHHLQIVVSPIGNANLKQERIALGGHLVFNDTIRIARKAP